MVGHATTLIPFRNINVLTEPVWSERASPVFFAGPRRVTGGSARREQLLAVGTYECPAVTAAK
jgi:L-ascorbate metabolism protein UlaG (beta-lactamase superfamily)